MAEGKGYGFYVTNRATEKITSAMKNGTKVELKQVAFGIGGDPEEKWNYDRTSLNAEATRKDFDPINDKYEQDTADESQVIIQVMVPDEYEGSVTEIGFFDTDDELFAYSCVPDKNEGIGKTDPVPTHIVYKAYLKLLPEQAERVVINVISGEYEALDGKIKELENEVTGQEGLTSRVEKVESSIQDLGDTSKIKDLAEMTDKIRQLVPSGTQIDSGSDDLNSDKYMKMGNYYCPMASTAKTLGNCPTDHGFMMEVLLPLNSDTYVARIITDSVGDQWYQSGNKRDGSFTYTSWDKIMKESALTELSTRVQTLETTLEGLAETLETLI